MSVLPVITHWILFSTIVGKEGVGEGGQKKLCSGRQAGPTTCSYHGFLGLLKNVQNVALAAPPAPPHGRHGLRILEQDFWRYLWTGRAARAAAEGWGQCVCSVARGGWGAAAAAASGLCQDGGGGGASGGEQAEPEAGGVETRALRGEPHAKFGRGGFDSQGKFLQSGKAGRKRLLATPT